jgi:hypothetical protein
MPHHNLNTPPIPSQTYFLLHTLRNPLADRNAPVCTCVTAYGHAHFFRAFPCLIGVASRSGLGVYEGEEIVYSPSHDAPDF